MDFDLGDIEPFRPQMRMEGGHTVVPVTFLDGSSVELLIPRTIDITSRGLTVYSVGQIKRYGRDFWIFPASLDQVLLAFGCPEAVNAYDNGVGRSIGLWHFPADRETDYLAFLFGDWTVLVYDYRLLRDARMTNPVRALWARKLKGRESRDGFLVLRALPPLRLAGQAGWNRHEPTLTLKGDDGAVEFVANSCPTRRQESVRYWCLHGHVTVKVLGNTSLARSLHDALDSRRFKPPER